MARTSPGSLPATATIPAAQKAGIAPGASLVVLKVLDANGNGSIANIIAALDWVAANYQTYNIRVVNMSVGARVYESYWTDPLTLATKALTDKGITVVAAAGNFGENTLEPAAVWRDHRAGQRAVGPDRRRLEHDGDADARRRHDGGLQLVRADVHRLQCEAGSRCAGRRHDFASCVRERVTPTSAGGMCSHGRNGDPGYLPYLSLSGTSMATPVVTGTVALMLQANPNLTPNLVKAILQYTAQMYPGYNALRQGAGFLNSLGAVRLAQFYANNRRGSRLPVQAIWSKQIIWGNHLISGGYLNPQGNAWSTQVVWGAANGPKGSRDHIVWGTDCGVSCDNIVWGTDDMNGDNIVWGTARRRQHRLGHQHSATTSSGAPSSDGDNIVWGTDAATTTSCGAPTAAAPTATTSSGARTTRTTSSGAPTTPATTSCGAPTTATTSCGAPRSSSARARAAAWTAGSCSATTTQNRFLPRISSSRRSCTDPRRGNDPHSLSGPALAGPFFLRSPPAQIAYHGTANAIFPGFALQRARAVRDRQAGRLRGGPGGRRGLTLTIAGHGTGRRVSALARTPRDRARHRVLSSR